VLAHEPSQNGLADPLIFYNPRFTQPLRLTIDHGDRKVDAEAAHGGDARNRARHGCGPRQGAWSGRDNLGCYHDRKNGGYDRENVTGRVSWHMVGRARLLLTAYHKIMILGAGQNGLATL
jgi:hypothetical protein